VLGLRRPRLNDVASVREWRPPFKSCSYAFRGIPCVRVRRAGTFTLNKLECSKQARKWRGVRLKTRVSSYSPEYGRME